ncbi:PDZ domain-containing protein [Nocardia vermiculata]|uniref:PDZ domain-containing protein n=2 Tax=Nocardia vermiculata TaxID=257274 RepID=A0A846XU54_9NOCA|nr:PDZ domain-containing protein [Nocardia vermiculata]
MLVNPNQDDAQEREPYEPRSGAYGPQSGAQDSQAGTDEPRPYGDGSAAEAYGRQQDAQGPGTGGYSPQPGAYGSGADGYSPGPGAYGSGPGGYGSGPGGYGPYSGTYGAYGPQPGGYGPHPGGHESQFGGSHPGTYGARPGGSGRGTSPAHRLTFGLVAAVVAVIALTIGLVGSRIDGHGPSSLSPLGQGHAPATQPIDAQASSTALEQAANAVVPGLVVVNTEMGMQGSSGAGTGIVIGSDGTVLTNNHVVEGATDISVTDLGNGRTYSGAVAGFDRQDDLAVVKLQGASDLETAPLGDSDTVKVGDDIVGVGNAGGTGTPTGAAGKVTALDRSITASDESAGASEQLTGLIQVAANIQPGDSGGPLINSSGEVIGVNTAASQGFRLGTGGGQGFAIPINKAISVAEQIQSGTGSDRVHIGDAAFLGITMSDADGTGALIRGVVTGGPAEAAGLTPGDVITKLDDTAIDSATTLTHAMDQHHPGDTITLTWTTPTGQTQSAPTPLTEGPVG